jgi:cytochrome b6
MSIGDYIRNSQVWKSIFRHPAPRDRRNRVVVMLTNVFLHLHPVGVRKSGIALSYTWCMGGLTFFLFLVETVTGVLLMFYYRPTLEHAYNDMLALRDVVTLGILRELHRWARMRWLSPSGCTCIACSSRAAISRPGNLTGASASYFWC